MVGVRATRSKFTVQVGMLTTEVETCVRLRHLPTGLEVKAQSHRSQVENRVSARRRLAELYKSEFLGMETKRVCPWPRE
eukprot:2931538-Amphidinium_carterae.1